jgi:tRNA pseudouridine38-40 synthase
MRVKITLSYNGSKFFGFQSQNSGVLTVSNRLKKAFCSLGIKSKFDASGRTDRGVHAARQVISIDIPKFWGDLDRLRRYLNRALLPDIKIVEIVEVKKDFHARFSAKSRCYRYLVKVGETDIFKSDYITFIEDEIDQKRICEAIKLFEGEHDFRAFQKMGSDTASTIRVIKRVRFYKYRDIYVFSFEANGFLRSQIRLMVDFLLKIGSGKLSLRDLKLQLYNGEFISRELAPPNGLYLSRIKY